MPDPVDDVDRLRTINRELVCSHNDLLVVIARQDDENEILQDRCERLQAANDIYDQQWQPPIDLNHQDWLDVWYALAEEYGTIRADDLGNRMREPRG